MNRLSTSAVLGLISFAVLAAPSAGAAVISTSNVDELELLWDFPLGAGVTSTPVLGNGLVYAGSWDGTVYALDPETGSTVWSFDTGSGGGPLPGVPGNILVDPNGNVCFGDILAHIWCRDGLDGSPIWDKVVGTAFVDAIWSGLATVNGRLFVSVASLQDVPCTQGRLLALDLANGADLWSLVTVPDKICDTDTSVECTTDGECGVGGSCVDAQGAGVTATVSFDPNGNFVYMNTVGCFTFPSVGDSDTIFKIDAATGSVVWKTRVNPPEQFGFCDGDPNAAECGLCTDPNAPSCSATPCAVGTCTDKCPEATCPTIQGYHDYGFLNGPVRVETTTAGTLLVSGSKNGTLYALNEPNGTITWANSVLPLPVSPDFAGFGLFNGPIAIANGRVHAALNEFNPVTDPNIDHLQAFDLETGATLWTDEIGPSWSGIGLANSVVYTGNNDTAEFFAYNAGTGVRLATFTLPDSTVSRATVVGDTLYIGYGIFGGTGGVRAYRLPPSEPPTGIPTLPGSGLLLLAALVAIVAAARLLRRAQA